MTALIIAVSMYASFMFGRAMRVQHDSGHPGRMLFLLAVFVVFLSSYYDLYGRIA